MEADYKVKLEVFEGPLDLLLYLIKRDEIDIYDISIERITRQYLEYLQAFKELKIDVAGEFVVMAANLIYLKSRSLLPLDQQPPEEDAEEDDPRWDLIRKLIADKKFKEAAAQLHGRSLEQERLFTRDGGSPPSDAPLPLHEVGIFQLIHAFQEVIKRVEAREDLREIFGERFSVSDKIEKILERVSNGTPVRFSELFGQIVSRVEIVVTFLALLELIRLNQVRALQPKMFDEIYSTDLVHRGFSSPAARAFTVRTTATGSSRKAWPSRSMKPEKFCGKPRFSFGPAVQTLSDLAASTAQAARHCLRTFSAAMRLSIRHMTVF